MSTPSTRKRRQDTTSKLPLDAKGALLEGTLERVVFSNDDNGWTVVRLAVDGQPGPVTAVGHLAGVQPGENLRLIGEWVTDPKFGRQFRIESFASVAPSTLAGIERYLGSGLVEGIGKEMARRLVKHFGAETLDVVDHDGKRLTEVEGIGPKRSRQILEAWAGQRHIRDVMVFLQGHGVSTSHAVRIYKRYGADAVETVRTNPYRLASDIFGIGFKTADDIARNLGIASDSPRRAEAGVVHTLLGLADDGHVFAPRAALIERGRALLDVDRGVIDAAIGALTQQGDVVVDGDGDSAPVYARPLYTAENIVARRLLELRDGKRKQLAIDIERALDWFETRAGIELADAQRQALRRTALGKLVLITGGPGTGKTTIIQGLLHIFTRKGLRVTLCAPTGRAAKRMTEATGHEAKTIHRLLEWSPRHARFERDATNPLDCDCLVVDELSMVDVPLARYLFEATPTPARVVLVGDADQLPSVGPGNVLGDLIDSGAADVVELTEIFRQSRASRIITNAHRINHGDMPELDTAGDRSDFYFIERDEPERAAETILNLVAERVPRGFGFDPVDDVQVLTPMHRGVLGATRLNIELQALLTPPGPSVNQGSLAFRAGDKIMQIRNNYDLDVFNGDIGRVVAVDPEGGRLTARFDDRRVEYDRGGLDELTLAYACSIHKSQGSEYRAVVIPVHTQHFVMLRRNLLYTGVTRGRELVVLVGSKKALAIGVNNADVAERWSGLVERLRG